MVMEPALAGFLAAGVAALATGMAEWLHWKRSERVARLAFGSRGQARRWVAMSPVLRTGSAACIAFGLVVLGATPPAAVDQEPTQEASKHLLVCLDASPSMFVEDAGPDGKSSRTVWAGQVVQAILDRLDTETTRVTVFAVYTKSIPVIEDTYDMNVVRNVLDGLPLYAAFNAGPTKLSSGVNDALVYARQWQPKSATLLVISDGDSEEAVNVRGIPPSIADSIIVGVGDPVRPTMISGHRSTQDTRSLKLLADKLKGLYHQGNNKHLPSQVLDHLTMIRPRIGDGLGLREVALSLIGIGGSILGLVGPLLILFGRSEREHAVRVPIEKTSARSNTVRGKLATSATTLKGEAG